MLASEFTLAEVDEHLTNSRIFNSRQSVKSARVKAV